MAKSKPGRDGDPLELVPARGHEVQAERGQVAMVRNLREHPIDTLLERDTIEGYHHQAAEHLLRDWQRAQISPSRASSFEPAVDGGRSGDMTESQAHAFGQVKSAMESLGKVNRVIVMQIVVGRKNLEELGHTMRAMGHKWPPKRYAGPRLCEALHELAEHYGLATRRVPFHPQN